MIEQVVIIGGKRCKIRAISIPIDRHEGTLTPADVSTTIPSEIEVDDNMDLYLITSHLCCDGSCRFVLIDRTVLGPVAMMISNRLLENQKTVRDIDGDIGIS